MRTTDPQDNFKLANMLCQWHHCLALKFLVSVPALLTCCADFIPTALYHFFFPSVLFIFLLYNIVLVLPYIDMNLPWVYMSSPSWSPLLPPSPSHRSGSSSAPAPRTLYHALNLDWRFISHVTIYMFQCHSPISSHSRPLPQSPKVCSICLCLFCCLAYRVIVTIFLNSIYMR